MSQARAAWPLLRNLSGGKRAWERLVGELELMGVQPLPGLREESAEGCYKTAGGAHGSCASDAATVATNEGERRYEELLQNLRQGGEPATRVEQRLHAFRRARSEDLDREGGRRHHRRERGIG